MRRILRAGYCAGPIALLCAVWVAPAGAIDSSAPAEVNLLRLPTAHIERSTATLDDASALTTLFEDNPAVVPSVKAQPNVPLDVVFGFEGAVVTADRVTIRVPQASSTARIEILVSTLSPQAGFRSVRSDPLAPKAAEQELSFQPAAARWIMLRFTPSVGRDSIDAAAVKVLGHEGAPASNYAFKQSPAAALDVLARLKTISAVDISVSPDEQSLFADAADGKLDQWSYEEAALIASGVRTAQDRAPYLARLAAIEAAAAQAVGPGGTAFDRGGRLLRWLYQSGALKSYVKDQTDLSALLDSGGYNCVSSALLYTMVGRHLGLDVRAIEVPDHAFAVLYDGTLHADIETTVEGGFNPDRDPKSLGLFERLTGFSRPPTDKRELRREVGDIGLAAVVYYNHGVINGNGGRNALALADYFRALSLDPENATAVKNTLGTMANWSVDLIRAQRFQEAVQELAAGLTLAPDDALLNDNQLAAWQQWATTEIQAGRRDAALAILRNAAQAAPRGGFEAMQTWIYISPAEDLAKREHWADAIAIIDAARPGFQGQQLADIKNYETDLYNRQAMALVKDKKWPEAQAVYAAAQTRLPGVDLLKQNEIFVWASWCMDDEGSGNFTGMLDVAEKAHHRFPDDAVLAQNEKAAWSRLSLQQAQHGDFAAALNTLTSAYQDFPGDRDLQDAERPHWINWSNAQNNARNWAQAIDICERGLQRFPGDHLLERNELAAWFGAGQAHFNAKQWQEAIHTYAQAQERFPDDKNLVGNELATWSNWGNAHVQAGEWQDGIDVYEKGRARFPGDQNLRSLELSAWINWSKALIDAAQWQQSIEVAQRGLKIYPDGELLKGNELAAWGNWGNTHVQAREWQDGIDVYEKARVRFPEDRNLRDLELNSWINWSKALIDAAQWQQSIEVAQRGLKIYPDGELLKGNELAAWANWGKTLEDRKDWKAAIETMVQARNRFQADKNLETIERYCWIAWIKSHADQSDWPGALALTEQGLQRFPDDDQLQNARRVCQSHLGKA